MTKICLLTIFATTYNSIRFIRSCIENVIQQRCVCEEQLIIDGGSSGGTLEIIQKYASSYSHIRYNTESDQEQSSANMVKKVIHLITPPVLIQIIQRIRN
jgi:glycosyltransferase involved in cell wall biosynthesis